MSIEWMEVLQKYESHLPWLLQVLGIFCITAVIYFFEKTIIRKLIKFETLHKKFYSSAFLYGIEKPLVYLIWILGFTFMLTTTLEYFERPKLLAWTDSAVQIFVTILLGWSGFRFLYRLEQLLLSGGTRHAVNRTTVLAVGRLARIALFVLLGLLLMQALRIEISGIVTLGSAGTLVLGFAAKELLSNFFGGLMLFTDRPFVVGDWIRSPDKSIEGVVEHIGWRLTKITTFQKRPLYVPNSVFLTISIENPSRMKNRRIKEVVGLRYKDASHVSDILREIESMLMAHPEIDSEATLLVAMNHFGPSSLDCMVYCYTKTTDWKKYLTVQQEVLLKINEIVESYDAEIAFPTTTLDLPEQAIEKYKY